MLACSLESRTDGSDITTAVYDALGNLLTVVLPDARQIDYVVDPLNRRIGKKENGALVKTWLYQDGLRPVAEVDDTGNLRARFVYASARNVPDTMITYAADGTEEATYRVITDHLGSVRLVVDASTGAVAQRMVHDVWGNVLEDTNPGFQPFGFAGGLYDADTGLVRFGARDYDPEVGRWTAKDPILFGGRQANLYVYVRNEPANNTDPTGQVSNAEIECHIVVTLVTAACLLLKGGKACLTGSAAARPTLCSGLEDSEYFINELTPEGRLPDSCKPIPEYVHPFAPKPGDSMDPSPVYRHPYTGEEFR